MTNSPSNEQGRHDQGWQDNQPGADNIQGRQPQQNQGQQNQAQQNQGQNQSQDQSPNQQAQQPDGERGTGGQDGSQTGATGIGLGDDRTGAPDGARRDLGQPDQQQTDRDYRRTETGIGDDEDDEAEHRRQAEQAENGRGGGGFDTGA